MSKIILPIITNNLIATVIHILIGLLTFPPIILLLLAPYIFFAMIVPYTLFVCGLYFLAGRLFLRNTKNAVADFISVVGLVIAIIAVTLLAYANLWVDLWTWSSLLLLPFFTLGLILVDGSLYPLQIPTDEGIFIFMTLSLLAPLVMWVGLRARQYVSTLEIQQLTLKNRLLLILSKKKQSFILFIALICSPYFFLVILVVILTVVLIVTYEIEVLLGWR
jgi:hypothetical protein